MNILHTELAFHIHNDNIKAGWWTDLKTGLSIIETRNRPEMLMLIVSELSEASEGWAQDLPDDKLPRYPMFDVELADAAIRIYDLLGAEAGGINFDKAVRAHYEDWKASFSLKAVLIHLMYLVNCISASMEGFRKGKRDVFLDGLWKALGGIYAVSEVFGMYDLSEVIEAKRLVNSSRSDHKLENRRKAGGKQF